MTDPSFPATKCAPSPRNRPLRGSIHPITIFVAQPKPMPWWGQTSQTSHLRCETQTSAAGLGQTTHHSHGSRASHTATVVVGSSSHTQPSVDRFLGAYRCVWHLPGSRCLASAATYGRLAPGTTNHPTTRRDSQPMHQPWWGLTSPTTMERSKPRLGPLLGLQPPHTSTVRTKPKTSALCVVQTPGNQRGSVTYTNSVAGLLPHHHVSGETQSKTVVGSQLPKQPPASRNPTSRRCFGLISQISHV